MVLSAPDRLVGIPIQLGLSIWMIVMCLAVTCSVQKARYYLSPCLVSLSLVIAFSLPRAFKLQ